MESVPEPTNVQVTSESQDQITLSWVQPEPEQGSISHYRVFLQQKNSAAPSLTIETSDQKTFYHVRKTPGMVGQVFGLTIQAINQRGKMSILSDPVTFEIHDAMSLSSTELPIPAPIVGLSSTQSSTSEILLVWPEMPEAHDYKLYWDQGSNDNLNVLVPLAQSTNNRSTFTVNYDTSQHILGSDFVTAQGGSFKFWVSYFNAEGKESAISNELKVTV